VIWSYDKPLVKDAGFLVLRGNLFDSAIMKTSVISKGIPRPLSDQSQGPERVRGPRHRVRGPGGLSPPHRRSRARYRRALHPVRTRLPVAIGYPGGAEVVNMQPPAALINAGSSMRW